MDSRQVPVARADPAPPPGPPQASPSSPEQITARLRRDHFRDSEKRSQWGPSAEISRNALLLVAAHPQRPDEERGNSRDVA